MFFWQIAAAWCEISTKTHECAPRLSASNPVEPVPQNRSATRASCTMPYLYKIEKSDSFTRSVIGLVSLVFGGKSFRPRFVPEIIRIVSSWFGVHGS